MANTNGRTDVKSWLQFTIRLATLIMMLSGGFAVLYARLCIVETKVETALERLASLEAKVDAQNEKSGTRVDGVAQAR
jgi:hypothetical protein